MITCPKCKRGSWPEEGMPCPVPECGRIRGRLWVVPRLPPPTDHYKPDDVPPVAAVTITEDAYERSTWVGKGVRYFQWHKVQ